MIGAIRPLLSTFDTCPRFNIYPLGSSSKDLIDVVTSDMSKPEVCLQELGCKDTLPCDSTSCSFLFMVSRAILVVIST